MAGPFLPPQVVLDGFKERPEGLVIQGLVLIRTMVCYSNTRNVQAINSTLVHRLERSICTRLEMNKVRYPSLRLRTTIPRGMLLDETGNAALTKTITVSKRPVEQLGYLKDVNSLVVLSGAFVSPLMDAVIKITVDATVTLFPIPDLQPPSPLSKAKAAFSFTIHTSVQHISPPEKSPTIPVPTVVSYLVIACRRKLVIYSWKDGEPQEVQVTSPMLMPLSELKVSRKLLYPTRREQCPS